jgi:hypothetical protein
MKHKFIIVEKYKICCLILCFMTNRFNKHDCVVEEEVVVEEVELIVEEVVGVEEEVEVVVEVSCLLKIRQSWTFLTTF